MMTNEQLTYENWPAEAIPEHWIKSLFEKMISYYGAKFSDQWRGNDPDDMKRIWAIELGKLTREELKTGFEKLMNEEWSPSLPRFVKLCRPDINPVNAYYEAIAGLQARQKGDVGVWSHPAIFWASAGLSFDLMSQTFSQIKARWESALEQQLNNGSWDPIPATAKMLQNNNKRSSNKSAEVLKNIENLGIVKDTSSKFDHKRWAKRIKERQAKGDKTLLQVQIDFANEALIN